MITFCFYYKIIVADDLSLAINSNCDEQVNIILPIIERSKTKEVAKYNAILTERLATEIPCSYLLQNSLNNLLQISEKYKNNKEQSIFIANLSKYIEDNREEFIKTIQNNMLEIKNKNIKKYEIIGGFYDEFFGNISVTVINYQKNTENIILKVTRSFEQGTIAIAEIAKYLRGERDKFIENIVGEHERIPVFIQKIKSLDVHPLSENLAQEIDLFIRSRLLFPMTSGFLERKAFFILEMDKNKSNYYIDIKIRKEDSKLYATILLQNKNLSKRITSWVESDLNHLADFEMKLLERINKDLNDLEGIKDYGVTIGLDTLINTTELQKFVTLNLRQNYGNAALSLRLRSGFINFNDNISYSFYGAGLAGGWQFSDFRFIVADTGLQFDGGLITFKNTLDKSEKVFWFSYGIYVQTQISYNNNFIILLRTGLERSQTLDKIIQDKFKKFYLNSSALIGYQF